MPQDGGLRTLAGEGNVVTATPGMARPVLLTRLTMPTEDNARKGSCNMALGNTRRKIYNGIDVLLIKFLQLYYSSKGVEVVPATKLSSEDIFVRKLQIVFSSLSKSKPTSPKATP